MPDYYNLFKFLEDKKREEIPFLAKALYNPSSLTKEDLIVDDFLPLHGIQHEISLPDNLEITGFLSLFEVKMKELPKNLTVGEDLTIQEVQGLTRLPDNLTVYGDLNIDERDFDVMDVPENLKIYGDFYSVSPALYYQSNRIELGEKIKTRGGFIGGSIIYGYK